MVFCQNRTTLEKTMSKNFLWRLKSWSKNLSSEKSISYLYRQKVQDSDNLDTSKKSYYFVRHVRMYTFGAKVITPS